MNPELLTLLILAGAVSLACLVLYLLFKVIDSRPDIAALFSIIAMSAGFLGLILPDMMSPAKSLLTVITGCLFLIFAGFTYNRNRGNS